MYEPWNALDAPRFTGPRTYARLPYIKDLAGVDAAVFGMPWDGGASFRGGARFGPEAVRSASGMIRTYNAVQKVQVFGALSTIDYGDTPTAPGYIEDTLARITAFVTPLAQAGVVSIGIGGDHSVTLAELRALAAVHGPLGLVHLDSHTDLWDEYNGHPYSHGTNFRRALEEGVVDPARMLQAGIRGAALRRGRRGDPRGARRRHHLLDRAGRDHPGAVGGARPGPARRRTRVPLPRRGLRRRRVLPRHRDPRGGRPDELSGAVVPARARRAALRRL
ncbi:MAG TPA: arginase family protein [Solirubrobacteraceae bacterium]